MKLAMKNYLMGYRFYPWILILLYPMFSHGENLSTVETIPGFTSSSDSLNETNGGDTNNYHIVFGTVFIGNNLLPEGQVLSFKTGNNLVENPMNPDTVAEVSLGFFQFVYYHNITSTFQVIPDINVDPLHNPEYFPTYLGGEIYWEDAVYFVPGYIDSLSVKLAKRSEVFYGHGKIAGTIFPGTFPIETMANICIFLLNESQQPLKYAFLTSDSTFSLNNIPDGNFYLLIDKFGLKTKPIPITLTPENRLMLLSFSLGDENNTKVINAREHSLQISPNPFTSQIHIFFDTPDNQDNRLITIYDITGKEMYSETFDINLPAVTIESGHFENGIYILKTGNKAYKMVKK